MADQGKRVAIVTGAGKGLGAAFAHAIAADGTRVLVNNRHRAGQPDSAAEVAAAIVAAGGEAIVDRNDVTDPSAAAAMVDAALERWGRIDALVLNAGINGAAAKVGALDSAGLRSVMETNFFAAAALAQAALPHLLAAAAGRIVFVASTAGLHGVRGRAPYAASKGALTAFALSLADEVARSALRVNILCPYAATPMTAGETAAPDPRLAPERVGDAAAWLASAASALNGEIVIAGGGHYRRARTLESRGCAANGAFGEHWPAIADMAQAREFRGAMAAFADLHAQLEEPQPCV